MKSILQTEKVCFICGTTLNLHDHHVIHGNANRKQSEKYGLKVYLCAEHHTGENGVHFNKDMDDYLKRIAQEKFESEIGSRESFREIFGKSFL